MLAQSPAGSFIMQRSYRVDRAQLNVAMHEHALSAYRKSRRSSWQGLAAGAASDAPESLF